MIADTAGKANDTIDAIRTARVDALVVQGEEGPNYRHLKVQTRT
jgi:hypothetical protein